ncbi:hypothetical protein A2526_01170 [candidate division WOR-1 bacterium RIFOXYD2_FULL_36_8]|uniref:Uncharacterized protein n=1 Tax=candidate division WOR-1 bacterium RIFOXYB2_FULL_36_35 TaxID=1802578 RepID=A0A1F4S495_UNCSA|nr:MAG: hypothetical protein A2230_00815 [candidate division WOR-1 bacterium RIFOXYA2_FULL_36_21]OGC14225.1 MAG: hypothetical protein A2282_06530 [candidate division WOR-1 bacterium RIFOXYA12_FULL_36_13]OGC15230.1 MAG: hypothetical protein A2290_03025 [candidate division WOR-1 bacterium RIFOXYB2_FULL_36_35]OGC38938.1 MAG: hypothetical protein A2526_01170 [candidate division WOR-1 bacterium RIFOXYD2_FULL_36_8]
MQNENAAKTYIILTNLLFVVGVLFFGWTTLIVFLGFFIEAIINYLFNIARLSILFFKEKRHFDFTFLILSQSAFIFVNTVFFFIIFALDNTGRALIIHGEASAFQIVEFLSLIIVILIGTSQKFYKGFLKDEKYKEISSDSIAEKSYGSIILLQFLNIFGFGLILFFSLHRLFSLIIVFVKFMTELLAKD